MSWRPRSGVEVQTYYFFNLGAGWELVVNANHRLLYPPEREPVHVAQEEWTPEPVWTGAEQLTPTGIFDPQTVQPVGSRYTHRAISGHTIGL